MNYLIVDYGTSSCRASLVSSDSGKIIVSCRKETSVLTVNKSAEIDTDTAWDSVLSVIRHISDNNAAAEISAVGISSLLGWVFLNKNNTPVQNSIIWMDTRKSAAFETSIKKNSSAVYKKTGRKLSNELLVSKWAWLLENSPETAESAVKIISLKDEFIRRLTGEIITDIAHLDYTMLWNIKQNNIDSDMLEIANIKPGMTAPALYPYQQAGFVSGEAAAATGLKQGTPVIAGSIDGTTAMYGGGMAETGKAVLVSGTTDVLMTLTSEYLPDNPGCSDVLTVNNGMVPGTFAAGGSTGTSGGALLRIVNLFDGELENLIDQASGITPGAEGLLFSAGLSGERAPYWDPDITGGLFGLRMNHKPGHIIRALLEGTAFRLRRLADELFILTGKPENLFVLGGGSEIECWNSIKADISGIPLCRPAETEATTIGTAMFCDCFIRNSSDLEKVSKKWIKSGTDYSVDFEKHEIYSRLFRIFEGFIEQNKENYAVLGRFARM